jgi:hypothetical protein
MMTMPFHLAGMALPISPELPDLLRSVVRAQQLDLTDLSTLTFNFRSPGYSAETGGVHPVELRLIRGLHGWVFDYITDFSYQGLGQDAELCKELDFNLLMTSTICRAGDHCPAGSAGTVRPVAEQFH